MGSTQTLSNTYIKITSMPPGGAPEKVRKAWVGLTLKVNHRNESRLADVLTGQEVDRKGGWAVKWEDAMLVLGGKEAQAAEWWAENIVPIDLIFTDDCCEVETF
jgi:hypothetical protein